VLFFIELGTRRIHLAGYTSKPNAIWVSQQARQLIWEVKDEVREMNFLIHDNDTKFSSFFDNAFTSEGMKVVHTPYRAPKANSYAERWVRSVREEFLDQILVVNENHLRNILRDYTNYYNHNRPHQGISQHFPVPKPRRNLEGAIRRRDILGGIIHNYSRRPRTPYWGNG
jgi:putative transposase